ncbi:MAG TPA: DNA-processing protein DprA [Fibrobacteraceae bacterium]|nr:DNA-processing protein DprA [Fibrobacteraceae bacterium]
MPQKIDEIPVEAWIAMSLRPGFGCQSFRKWLQKTPPQQASDTAGLRKGSFGDAAIKILDTCKRHGISILAWGDSMYPEQLAQSQSALPILYTKGRLAESSLSTLALVGTRTPSWNGRATAKALVQALQGYSVSVVSGLAHGIDSVCHQAALEHHLHTTAVLAQGLDLPIGGERGRLAEQILEKGGAWISPFPPGTPAYPGNFLARNGIIAGLSCATVVVESRIQGGAMNTAEHCLSDERTLLAVPGDILRDSAQGTNMLCETGEARPIWIPEQLPLLAGLGIKKNRQDQPPPPRHAFVDLFAGETCSLEEILQRSERPLPELLQTLGELELDGQITLLAKGLYQFPVQRDPRRSSAIEDRRKG